MTFRIGIISDTHGLLRPEAERRLAGVDHIIHGGDIGRHDIIAVNKHRSWTPGLREANLLIYFVNLADNRGPDRRRPGPHPERIFSRYIKALRSSELGSRFGAYSHSSMKSSRSHATY